VDETLIEDGAEPVVRLARWTGPWTHDDPDANFKAEVATYSQQDPLATVRGMGRNLGLPVGAIIRYVLARWASGGSEGLLELGPSTVERMRGVVAAAEAAGIDGARLHAYQQLAAMVGWLGAGLDDPEGTYPQGGASD
jgi:hypothetical protein